MRWFRDIKAT